MMDSNVLLVFYYRLINAEIVGANHVFFLCFFSENSFLLIVI